MTNDMPTSDEMYEVVRKAPGFLYTYSPEDTEADRRFVFQDKTLFSIKDAYIYATS